MLPEFLKIGSLSISGYAFFYGLGLVLACLMVFILASSEHLDRLETVNYLLFLVIVSLLGAKLYGAIVVFLRSPSAALRQPEMLWRAFLTGGVFYGGLLAGTLYVVLYLKRYFKNAFWKMLDITAIAAALGHASGRVGCFLGGCCYGRPTRLPWGVRFPYLGGTPHPFADTAVHPTQLYEAGLNLINFAVLLILWKKRTFDGRAFSFYLINYGAIRFLIEYLRNDSTRGYVFRGASPLASLSLPQFISLGLIIVGFWALQKRQRAVRNA